MPFITLPGGEGKLYVPQHDLKCQRKHDCRNCFSCQMCSDDRCALCRKKDVADVRAEKNP